ncbi:MAG: PQQ-binding-like beta-propeller repeat protein, partial [Candidatus Hodarchaeota archaeon]
GDMMRIFAFNPDGTKKWDFYTSGTVYDRAPVISNDGIIYIGTYGGRLFALNPNGTEKWVLLNCGISTTVALSTDGTIYFGGHKSSSKSERKLIAVNPDGTIKWEFQTRGYMKLGSSPVVGQDGTIYIGTGESSYKLYAVNPDGTEKWSFDAGTYNSIYCTPAVGDDGTIYVGSENKFYAISKYGSKKWEKSFSYIGVYTSPAIDRDGTIYITANNKKLYALNTNGTEKWSYTLGDVGSSPIIGADGIIYVGSSDKSIYAIQPNGNLSWKYETDGKIVSSPTISKDGILYVGSQNWDYLYAIYTTSLGIKSCQWPKIHHDIQNSGRWSDLPPSSLISPSTGTIPLEYELYSNYPNPFNPYTNISFALPKITNVRISIFDINGKIVETILNSKMQAGYHTFAWNASNLPSGTYFISFRTRDFIKAQKCVLLK